jgi:hypothetical protein
VVDLLRAPRQGAAPGPCWTSSTDSCTTGSSTGRRSPCEGPLLGRGGARQQLDPGITDAARWAGSRRPPDQVRPLLCAGARGQRPVPSSSSWPFDDRMAGSPTS